MTETEATPTIKIESLKDLRDMLVVAKGGDPDAIQAVSNFMNMKSTTERANFPDKTLMLCASQLHGYGKLLYPNDDWDPFTLIAETLEVGTMGYKSKKSDQFVKMTEKTPNLDALKDASEEQKKSVLSWIGSGKE